MNVFFLPREKSLLLVVLYSSFSRTKISDKLLYIVSVSFVEIFPFTMINGVCVILS